MPNVIKSATTISTGTIKKNNFVIGVNTTVGYGPTSITSFWNGVVPPYSGYTVYEQKSSQGPSIRTVLNDSELITIAKQYGGTNINTITDALTYFNGQSNYLVANVDYPSIVTDSLVINLDAGYVPSYPRNGTVWTDLSGNNNNGTLTNGPTFNSDNGGSIVFDGTNDFVSIPIQNLDRPCTFSMWVNLSSLTGYQTFFGQDTSQSILRGRFYFQKPGGTAEGFILNKVNFSIVLSGGGVVPVNSNNVIVTNIWYNYTAVLTTTTISLYENGILQNTVNDSNTFLTPNTTITLNAGYYNNSIVDYINGKSSSFLIYNRALSSEEILQNYYAGLQRFIPTNGLILSLDANNTNGGLNPTIIYDKSGNNYNGIINNGIILSSVGGGSLSLDGVDDYIRMNSSTLWNLETSSTVSLWFSPTNSSGYAVCYQKGSWQGWIFQNNGGVVYSGQIGANDLSGYFGAPSYGQWQQHTLVVDRTLLQYRLYKNGVFVSSSSITQTAISSPDALYLGCRGSVGDSFSNSKIGEFKIYNRALTATEILTIYTATKSRYGL